MHTWQCIQKSIDYIEKNYKEPLNINLLANIANLSEFYYQRLFKKLVGKTVNDYILLRRLAYAIKELQTTNDSLLNIALSCGFNSDTTFSKVFKKIYGVTPSQVRKNKLTLDIYAQPKLAFNYTDIDLGVPLIADTMFLEINKEIKTEDILFIGCSKQSKVEAIAQPKVNDLISLWDDVSTNPTILEIKKDNAFYEVLTPDQNPEYFNFFVGIPTSKPHEEFDRWVMPKGEYYVCSYEAESFDLLVNESLYIASKYFYEVWLPKHNIKTEPFIVQKYTDPTSGIYGIEIWAKKAMMEEE